MKKLILNIFFLLSAPAYGNSSKNCFYDHLIEASQINAKRASIYSSLAYSSDGPTLAARSRLISSTLISSEKVIAITRAKSMDRQSIEFEAKYGINVNCLGYVSMEHIGATTDLPRPAPTESPVAVNGRSLQTRLNDLARPKNFAALKRLEQEFIEQISQLKSQNYNCMLRHILESALRFTQIAIATEQVMSKDASYSKFLWDTINLQIFGIRGGRFLDSRAEPLQKRGIPIICNDVPHIPQLNATELH